MALSSLSATNFSVKNAEEFVNSIKDSSRIVSFFIGGSDEETTSNLNTENRRRDVFKDASIIKKIDPSYVNVVIPKVNWTKQIYNRWTSSGILGKNYYVVNDNNVYLILTNDEFNRINYDGKIPTSIAPTHTSGSQKYDDGYTYLYLYTITAEDKANVNSASWMSVPDTTLTSFSGKLMYLSIDLDSISASNLIIKKKNPIIPILSDTGSGASIKLRTVIVSSPYATESERRYKIIGAEIHNHGTVKYEDYDLNASFEAFFTDLEYAQIFDIMSAITLGFSDPNGLNIRETLEAKYALVTCQIDSDEVKNLTEQREFYNFGVLENVLSDSNDLLFTGSDQDISFSNNLKVTIAALGTAGSNPDAGDFVIRDVVYPKTTTKVQKSAVVASKQINVSSADIELHTKNINLFSPGDALRLEKYVADYTVVAVDKPPIKQNSGKSLHIAPARYSIDNTETVNKRFFAQVIQRF